MSLFKSAFTVGSFTLCSRILGYIRDILIASVLGAGFLADAFFVAFRLPNFFRTLSAEGAFNAAFVPLFAGKLEEKGKDEAVSFASHVLSFMFFILLCLTIIMQIFMPAVMHVLAPGFLDDAEKFDVTVQFGRIVFPYLLFISLMSLFSGVLNSFGKFAVAASAPIWLNICCIFALLVVAKYTDTPAHALAWAVMVSGVIQFLWVAVAAYKNGARIYLSLPKLDDDVKILLKRMVPGIIGGGVTQINLWINTVIATTMAGAVSYLYYADRLVQFPLAIIGTAMGTALLPVLSRQIKGKKLDEAINTQNRALEIVMIFTIPAAVALIIIAEPLISVMFERGKFGAEETKATSAALIAYAVGLPAFVMIKIFLPSFFANGDTKTPVKIAAICLVANVTISLILIRYIGHVGLAVATSFSSWLNTSLLCGILIKRGIYKADSSLNIRLLKVSLSSAVMGVMLFYMQGFMGSYLSGMFMQKFIALSGLIISGVVAFFVVSYITKCVRPSDFRRLLKG
ncbi:MAG: murein biosynthesis integral membrane protein MurJ [Alphaproteobacteria bacterium CG11_big_fil_rev_8_21_14_0_20_39_49]|nr:MAG: murein biosynthesis integral membrane protein MurJ [Alphaproteobacteria bacterium CG11_big_fil_rev_8_21_14_0_20_39_49]